MIRFCRENTIAKVMVDLIFYQPIDCRKVVTGGLYSEI